MHENGVHRSSGDDTVAFDTTPGVAAQKGQTLSAIRELTISVSVPVMRLNYAHQRWR